MNLDTLMLGAFGIFVVLLIWWMREMLKKNAVKHGSKIAERKSAWINFNRWRMIVLLIILFGLLFYMVPLLWKDFQMLEERDYMLVGLRCLVFIFTISILFIKIGKYLKGRRVNTK